MQYLKNQKFPGSGQLVDWFRFFVKFAEDAMGKVALDGLMEIITDCMSKIPDVTSISTGKTTPTEKEYLDVRLIDIGISHQSYFILIDSNVELTDDLKNDPDWIGLNKQTSIHQFLVNDLYSLKKEVKQDSYKFNYVYVKMTNANMTAQEAVNEIVLEREESYRMVHFHGDRLKKRNDPNLSMYVDGVFASLIGNIYWSSTCKRYNNLPSE